MSPCRVEVSAAYQAHATLLDLSVCGGDKGGVWVVDGFVFPVEDKAQFYNGVRMWLLWMYKTHMNRAVVYESLCSYVDCQVNFYLYSPDLQQKLSDA